MVVPTSIRSSITSLFLFTCLKAEWDQIKKEHLYIEKGMDYLLPYIFKDPHNFFYIRLDDFRFFVNF